MKQWYEELFENYAEQYDKQDFTTGTLGEVDFVESEIGYDKNRRILDIGCGTGRHSIELARRGYSVVGVDLSVAQLNRAKEKANKAGVSVQFEQMDARELKFCSEFDLVLMLCEGAFPLMETDEMNYKILSNAVKVLRRNGKLILTTLNVLFPLVHNTQEFVNTGSMDFKIETNRFDLISFRELSTVTFIDDSGTSKTIHCSDRYYAPSEINWYLTSLGFRSVGIFGCKMGKFSRKDPLTPEDFEMLVVAEKI